jgi:SAM-dependent methyltransferase
MAQSRKEPVGSDTYDKAWIRSAWGDAADLCSEIRDPRPRVRRALELAQLAPGCSVLDIACGRGEVPLIAQGGGAFAVGLDFSADVLELAKAVRSQAPSGTLPAQFVRADAVHLPFAADSFDRVTLLDIVEHLTQDQLDRLFAEVRRVLTPGGYAVIHTLPNRWFYDVAFPVLSRLLPEVPRNPRSDIERKVHINEQDLPRLHGTLRRARLSSCIWLEQFMPAQARWHSRRNRFGDQRDRLYPLLARWPGRVLEILSVTPLRLLLSNDIFAVAWRDDMPHPSVKTPFALSERLALF